MNEISPNDLRYVKQIILDIIDEAKKRIIENTNVSKVNKENPHSRASQSLLSYEFYGDIGEFVNNIIFESVRSIEDAEAFSEVDIEDESDTRHSREAFSSRQNKNRSCLQTKTSNELVCEIDGGITYDKKIIVADENPDKEMDEKLLKNIKLKSQSFTKLSYGEADEVWPGEWEGYQCFDDATERSDEGPKIPFSFEWSIGNNFSLPIVRIGCTEVLVASSHIGLIYDFEQKKMQHLIGHQNNISSSSCNAGFLATADFGAEKTLVVLWKMEDMQPFRIYEDPFEGGVRFIRISEDGSYLSAVSASPKPRLRRWSLEDAMVAEVQLPEQRGVPVHFILCPYDRRHCSVTFQDYVCICEAEHSHTKFKIYEPTKLRHKTKMGLFIQTAYNSLHEQLITGTSSGQVVVVSTDGLYIKTVQMHFGVMTNIQVIDKTVALTYTDGSIWFYDHDLLLQHWFTQDYGPVISISYSTASQGSIPDFVFLTAKGCLVAGSNGGKKQTLLSRHPTQIISIACNPMNQMIVTGDREGCVSKYDVQIKSLDLDRHIAKCGITALEFSPNGHTLAAGCDDGGVLILDPAILTVRSVLPSARAAIVKLRFSTNSKHLAYYHKLMGVALFKLHVNWSLRGKFRAHFKPIVDMTFGDSSLYTIGEDRMLAEYEYKHALRIKGSWKIEQTAKPTSFAYINGYLLIATDGNKLRTLDVEKKQIIRTTHVPNRYPITKLIHSHERLIFAAGPYIGACNLPFRGFGSFVQAHSHNVVSLATDGKLMYSSGNDSVLVWVINTPLDRPRKPSLPPYIDTQITRLFESGPIQQMETIDYLRFLGVFPSQFETGNILRELAHPDVTENEFRAIYYHHKIHGPTIMQIRDALLCVSELTRADGPVVHTDRLVNALQNGLEPMTRDEILHCINILLEPTPLPPQMLLVQFITQVLGLAATLLADIPDYSVKDT